jgi:hypothetical protein
MVVLTILGILVWLLFAGLIGGAVLLES